MRGRGGWNRGGRGGGFRVRGGYNNGPNWDNNNGTNWDNNGVNNDWDNNGTPPVWQNQSMNRGGNMMGRGNLRPPLMQNVMGRGRGTQYLFNIFIYNWLFMVKYHFSDIWMDNNLTGGRGGRDSDNWSNRGSGGGRDSEIWGSRGSSRDSDGWGSRGNRMSPWRGNGNRRRNEDFEGPNQKRWRRDDNPEWDEQQKPWKRGSLNDDEEWQQNRQGSLRASGKNDDGNYSKFKNRDNNEERPRKPSKWSDRESDDKVKEDRWSRKPAEQTSSKNECNAEGLHQTSAPMDLDNYEGESTENTEQLHKTEEQESSNSLNDNLNKIQELESEQLKENVQHEHDPSNFNVEKRDQGESNTKQNVEQQLNDECHNFEKNHFEEHQNDFSKNSPELSHGNIDTHHNLESRFQGNIEQHSIEEKHQNECQPHNNYQEEDSHSIYNNSQQEYEKSQNYREIEQNQLVKPAYDNTIYENEPQSYEPTFSDKESRNSNQQEHCSIDNFASHIDENCDEKNVENKSSESRCNFYFGMDATNCDSSVDNLAEMEQLNNKLFTNEETTMVLPPDIITNEVQEIGSAEPSES